MTVQRLEHVGIVVNDLEAAIAFFLALGLKIEGRESVEGDWVDRIVGLESVKADLVIVETPDGHGKLELVKFHAPPSPAGDPHPTSNALGIRHILFAVDDIDAAIANLRPHGAELVGEVERYEDMYRLCYIRGPEGIIVELAQKLG